MVRIVFRASAIALACIVFMARAQAQVSQSNAATISGSVSDAAGKPVVGANVLLSGAKTVSMQTDAHGLFVFLGQPFGNYLISITSPLGKVQRELSTGTVGRSLTLLRD